MCFAVYTMKKAVLHMLHLNTNKLPLHMENTHLFFPQLVGRIVKNGKILAVYFLVVSHK
jgi:hypothetical protein